MLAEELGLDPDPPRDTSAGLEALLLVGGRLALRGWSLLELVGKVVNFSPGPTDCPGGSSPRKRGLCMMRFLARGVDWEEPMEGDMARLVTDEEDMGVELSADEVADRSLLPVKDPGSGEAWGCWWGGWGWSGLPPASPSPPTALPDWLASADSVEAAVELTAASCAVLWISLDARDDGLDDGRLL